MPVSRTPFQGNEEIVTESRNMASRYIRNILVIEDDEDTRYIIHSTLENEGYSVRGAVDRDEAIQHLGRALYQVIVMDLCMPGKSAAEFVRMVRKVSPGTQFVVITAAENAADATASLDLQYSVGKPLNLDELVALLERLEQSWK